MHSTTRLGLDVPDGTDNESAYPAVASQAFGILDNAVTFSQGTLVSRPSAGLAGRVYYATDTTLFYLDNGTAWVRPMPFGQGYLAYRAATTSTTASAGDWIVASPGVTITLPSASANAVVAVQAGGSVTGASPVTVSGSNIFGTGLSNPGSSFLLGTAMASAVLQSDGTNWDIVSGHQDSGWQALSLATNVNALSGYTPAARLRRDRVELCGGLTNGTGGSISPGVTVATIPTGLHPASFVNGPAVAETGTTFSPIGVTTAGQIQVLFNSWPSGNAINLDGVSFRLS